MAAVVISLWPSVLSLSVSEPTLIGLAVVGSILTGWSATANKVLHDYSRRDLELYCQRQQRLDLFGEILDDDEKVMIGAEITQLIGSVFLVLCTAIWYFQTNSQGSPLSGFHFVGGIFVGIFVLVAVVTWIPRTVGQLWATPFLYHSWHALKLMTRLLWPLRAGVTLCAALVRRLADRPESAEDEEEAFEDEIRSIVMEGLHEGLLEEEEREMIEGVMELGDTDVMDIMTPRSNIDAFDVQSDWSEVLAIVIEAGRTRLPVFEKTLDNIVGVLFVKDLLSEMARKPSEPRTPLRQLLRKPWYVPTTKPLNEMLQEFQHTRRHLAIVVDEYRSVAGVVTIEDVLEEIVGEIVDESDKEAETEIRSLSATTAEVLGSTHLSLVNERLKLDLPDEEDFDTVAGLVIRKLEKIPKPGDSIQIEGVHITIVEASRRRIELVRIEVATVEA